MVFLDGGSDRVLVLPAGEHKRPRRVSGAPRTGGRAGAAFPVSRQEALGTCRWRSDALRAIQAGPAAVRREPVVEEPAVGNPEVALVIQAEVRRT
jgi:hypothetical protein